MRVIRLNAVIKSECPVLFDHEFKALLEAVRRDLRKEQHAINEDAPERQQEHRANVRQDQRILDVLQPKHSTPVIEQPKAEETEEMLVLTMPVIISLETEDDTFQQLNLCI